jgi:hypothetical protein
MGELSCCKLDLIVSDFERRVLYCTKRRYDNTKFVNSNLGANHFYYSKSMNVFDENEEVFDDNNSTSCSRPR